MRILYGVQGTGNGHITRARMLGPAIERQGIQVDYLFSGRDAEKYFNMEPFGTYETRTGFTFATEDGQVDLLRTIREAKLVEFLNDVRKLDLSQYDLVVSDFEPVTAWAARLKGKRSIGIAHQYAFTHKVPGRELSKLMHIGIPIFTPVTDAIGLHWHNFTKSILPPMISPMDLELSFAPRKVLVYLPFENTKRVVEFLHTWQSYDFHLFADVEEEYSVGSVTVHPLSRENFKRCLASCAGVFTSAGFGVCSEAIQAGKGLLVKPLAGQFEQAANAAALERLSFGSQINSFDDLKFEHWLSSLSSAKNPRPWPATEQVLAEWIADGCPGTVKDLCQKAWSKPINESSAQLASTTLMQQKRNIFVN